MPAGLKSHGQAHPGRRRGAQRHRWAVAGLARRGLVVGWMELFWAALAVSLTLNDLHRLLRETGLAGSGLPAQPQCSHYGTAEGMPDMVHRQPEEVELLVERLQ
jgi:hypothetical protein